MTKVDTPPAPTPKSPIATEPTRAFRLSPWLIAALLLANVAIIAVMYNVRRGAVASRIANPAVQGAPRPVAPLFHHDWIAPLEFGTVLGVIALVVVCTILWQRYPKHPVLLMVFATTAIVWLDPVMNWAPYAVYNPQLTHFPETWPLVSLSPSVEPLLGVGYATFYLGAYFPAIWILRRVQARRPVDTFVWRHPLISLGFLILIVGFVYDAILETILVRTQLYIYSQVIPFGSIFTGKPYQFPLLWESIFVCWVMIPAGVLLYRDDTGKTQAEKLAQGIKSFRPFRGRPAFATFAVMFAILNVAYFCYGGSFAVIRATGAATSVACPWPFPEVKVYDPQGFYAKAGQPGPYMAGIWDGWESAQSGRPDVPTNPNGRCSPQNVNRTP